MHDVFFLIQQIRYKFVAISTNAVKIFFQLFAVGRHILSQMITYSGASG